MGIKTQVGKGSYLPGAGDSSAAAKDGKALGWASERNVLKPEKLTRMQRAALNMGTPCWIYNTSPIFKWTRTVKGHGMFTLLPREADKKVSRPIPIPHSMTTTYDKGDNRAAHYVEDGIEIAEGIVGCSKDYPSDLQHPTSNLKYFGVFITYGKPFEELEEDEQIALLSEAEVAHANRCQEMVSAGNNLYETHADWITDRHRQAAKFCIEAGLIAESELKWVNRNLKQVSKKFKECAFCGAENKAMAVKCINCKEIIDQEGYDALKVKKTE